MSGQSPKLWAVPEQGGPGKTALYVRVPLPVTASGGKDFLDSFQRWPQDLCRPPASQLLDWHWREVSSTERMGGLEARQLDSGLPDKVGGGALEQTLAWGDP